MVAISARDVAAMLEFVHEGTSDEGGEPFPSTVLSALARLIPSDVYVGYNETKTAPEFRVIDQVQIVGEPPPPSVTEAFRLFPCQNPMRGCLRAREQRALRLSDLLTRRQRRALEFNAAVWQPLGIDDALRVWLPAPKNHARSVYLERSGKNYTARDVALMSLLRPHFVRMRAHAEFRRGLNGCRGLTVREAEVLGWIANGKKNREIARLLFISPHTVRKHVEHIFEKLDVRTRTAAVARARSLAPAQATGGRPG